MLITYIGDVNNRMRFEWLSHHSQWTKDRYPCQSVLERRRLDDFMTWKEATSNDQSRKLILKIPPSHKQNAYFQEQGKFRDKFFGLPS